MGIRGRKPTYKPCPYCGAEFPATELEQKHRGPCRRRWLSVTTPEQRKQWRASGTGIVPVAESSIAADPAVAPEPAEQEIEEQWESLADPPENNVVLMPVRVEDFTGNTLDILPAEPEQAPELSQPQFDDSGLADYRPLTEEFLRPPEKPVQTEKPVEKSWFSRIFGWY